MIDKLTSLQPPTSTLLNLDEVKTWLTETSDHNDGLIQDIIGTVTEQLDGRKGILGRSVLPQTWKYEIQCFPRWGYAGFSHSFSCPIQLPYPPVNQIISFEYDKEDGTTQPLANAWIIDNMGRDDLTHDDPWPQDVKKMQNGIYPIRIIYSAGYANIPAGIKTAAKAMVAHIYDNRSEGVAGNSFSRNPAFIKMLRPYSLNT